MRRVAALQSATNRWQMMVVETERTRVIGIYMRPHSTRADWKDLLGRITQYRAKSRPTIVAGDFNVQHRTWTKGKTDVGGRALHAWMNEQQAGGPGPHHANRRAGYKLNAPTEPTCSRPTKNGYSESTIDLFLTANLRGFSSTQAALVFPTGVGGSDHAPTTLALTHPPAGETTPTPQFLPTPHRLQRPELQDKAVKYYHDKIRPLIDRMEKSTSPDELHEVHATLVTATTTPWTTKAAPKPARYRQGWTKQIDDIARQRTKTLRRQHRAGATKDQKQELSLKARRQTRLIKRLLK